MIHHNVYLTGELDLDNLTFKPDTTVKSLDYGFDFYAAQLNSNSDNGKNYLIAWSGLPNNFALDNQIFDGSLTLPREISIKNNKLYQNPIKGIESLRIEELKNNNLITIPSEILINDMSDSFVLRIFTKKELDGGLKLEYNSKTKQLILDKSKLENKYNLENGEVVKIDDVNNIENLRIFIDSNTIEIFVNQGEYSLTTRVYQLIVKCIIHF